MWRIKDVKLAVKNEREHAQVGIIPGRRVQVSGEMVHVIVPQEEAAPVAHPAGEPQVTLVREGEIVQAIEVTCSCGRKMRLRCVY
jgi:hypothetical protein